MNWLDGLIGAVSPKAGAKRIAWRSEMERLRKYEGATQGRRGDGWLVSPGSINSVNGPAIARLRDRSRWIARNFPYGKRAIENIALSVVGTGIRPAFMGTPGNTKRVKDAWKAWAESTHCDFDGNLNFYGLQRLIMRTVAESGEALIIKRYKKNGTLVPLQLQVLEPEFIDESKDTGMGFVVQDDGYVMQGVQYDKTGRKTGYWLYQRHPSEFGNISSDFVPISDVIHVFDVLRPGQVRGVPFGVSGFLTSRDFSDLQDARLMKEKVAASWAAFVGDMANVDMSTSGTTSGSKGSPLPDKIEPGAIEYLPPGKTITFPATPSTEGYGDYSRTVKESIAAGYGVTYASMTGDLTQVNFSSGRMGFIDAQRLVEDWQLNMMIPKFCTGSFMWFMETGFISSNLPRTVLASWTAPRRAMIDPDKETKALNEGIRAGLNSWEEAARELGWDPEELKEQLKRQKKMWDELELMPTSDARFDPTRSDPNAEETTGATPAKKPAKKATTTQ